MKKYERASFYGRYVMLCPSLRVGRKLKGCGMEPGLSRGPGVGVERAVPRSGARLVAGIGAERASQS